MRLVQKMFVGLSLVGSLTLGSCSKEDVQMVEPEVGKENTEVNLKSAFIVAGAYFAPTISHTGYDYYPKDWSREIYPGNPYYPGTPSVALFPTGVSNRTHAFGNASPANAWIKSLPAIPAAPGANSFATVTTGSATTDVDKRADVRTVIKNLELGKMYSIDVYVATTAVSGPNAGYAKKVWATASYADALSIDLTGKKAEWVKASITFKAWGPECLFRFAATSEADNVLAYAHIYVDKNSIKKLP